MLNNDQLMDIGLLA